MHVPPLAAPDHSAAATRTPHTRSVGAAAGATPATAAAAATPQRPPIGHKSCRKTFSLTFARKTCKRRSGLFAAHRAASFLLLWFRDHCKGFKFFESLYENDDSSLLLWLLLPVVLLVGVLPVGVQLVLRQRIQPILQLVVWVLVVSCLYERWKGWRLVQHREVLC